MKIHVYDTHVHTTTGQYIHFDVLVDDDNVNHVAQYAKRYLDSLGVSTNNIEQSRCNFCHSEMAPPEVQENIVLHGHSILRL
ncbi:hypothetical protein GCM10009111_17980 [Colwellia asteriadis]|uniref:DUF2024 family protein n=1 Tax=Colwellia asteriadis TaxID=517723 RepID=A0ABP3WG71_9GAMM